MKKYRIAALLLLLALLCTGCSIGDQETIAALRESDELWISYGLAAWENNVKEEDISYIFYDTEAIKYLSLYDHMFIYDAELSIPVAEQFFRFVAEEYGLKAILNTELRRDYKNRYLKSLGFRFQYNINEKAEILLREMDFESDETYKYILSNEKFRFCLPDLRKYPDAHIEAVWDYWDYFYAISDFMDAFTALVKNQDLTEYFDIGRRVDYRCDLLGEVENSAVSEDGTVDLASFYDACCEAVKVYAKFSAEDGANRMLGEGLARYFSGAHGINWIHQNYQCRIPLGNAAKGSYDSAAAAGDEEAQRIIAIYNLCELAGGYYSAADYVDESVFVHVSALVDRDYGQPETILEAAEAAAGAEIEAFTGSELTLAESESFVTWLISSYDYKTVLEAWKNDDFAGTFGKSYRTLKAEWQEFLKDYNPSSMN